MRWACWARWWLRRGHTDTANEAASASTAAADEEDEEGVLFSAKTKMLYQKHYIKKNAKEHDLLYLQKVIAEKKSDANYQVCCRQHLWPNLPRCTW